jgi:uncharacterized protein YodC (DUF2158 family)
MSRLDKDQGIPGQEQLDAEYDALVGREFKPGDVVELKSGSFPMTIVFQNVNVDPNQGPTFELRWDLYGPAGRSNRLMRGSLPGACLKIFKRDDAGDMPF